MNKSVFKKYSIPLFLTTTILVNTPPTSGITTNRITLKTMFRRVLIHLILQAKTLQLAQMQSV